MNCEELKVGSYRRISEGLLLALCILVGAFSGQRDFRFFQCAAPIFFGGGDVYAGAEYLTCAFPGGLPTDRAAYAFPYPPQIFALLAPVFLLPELLQRMVFVCASACAATTAFAVLTSVFRLHRSMAHARAALLVAITSLPLLSAIAMGQLSSFSLLLTAGFIACSAWLSARGCLIQGLLLGAFIAKPQIVWLLGLGSVIAAPELLRRRLLIGAGASALAITVAAWMMNPGSTAQFTGKDFESLLSFSAPTIPALLSDWLPMSKVAWAIICGGLALIFVFKTRVRKLPPPALASLLLAASVLTTPYLWSYDFTLLLPLAFAALSFDSGPLPLGARLMGLLACNGALATDYVRAFIAGQGKPDGADVWYPCVMLAIFAASAWRACLDERAAEDSVG